MASKIHVSIMRAFVSMRRLIHHNELLFNRIDRIELKQLETDQKFEQIFQALENKNHIPAQGIFFEGQVFDAYELASRMIRSAKTSIILIDNYISEATCTHLAKKNAGVRAILLSKNISPQVRLDLQKAKEQHGGFEISEFDKSHDRFLVIYEEEVYHLGDLLNRFGEEMVCFFQVGQRDGEKRGGLIAVGIKLKIRSFFINLLPIWIGRREGYSNNKKIKINLTV